jgi:hypothetical protein
MELIDNLIGVLKSEKDLYSDLYLLLQQEISSIIKWDIENINEINKKKNTYYCKEHLLDEAIKINLGKLKTALNLNELNIENLTDYIEDTDQKQALLSLRMQLLEIIEKTQQESIKIKILYRNNIKIIDEFFCKIGITGNTTYTKNKKIAPAGNYTFTRNI